MRQARTHRNPRMDPPIARKPKRNKHHQMTVKIQSKKRKTYHRTHPMLRIQAAQTLPTRKTWKPQRETTRTKPKGKRKKTKARDPLHKRSVLLYGNETGDIPSLPPHSSSPFCARKGTRRMRKSNPRGPQQKKGRHKLFLHSPWMMHRPSVHTLAHTWHPCSLTTCILCIQIVLVFNPSSSVRLCSLRSHGRRKVHRPFVASSVACGAAHISTESDQPSLLVLTANLCVHTHPKDQAFANTCPRPACTLSSKKDSSLCPSAGQRACLVLRCTLISRDMAGSPWKGPGGLRLKTQVVCRRPLLPRIHLPTGGNPTTSHSIHCCLVPASRTVRCSPLCFPLHPLVSHRQLARRFRRSVPRKWGRGGREE